MATITESAVFKGVPTVEDFLAAAPWYRCSLVVDGEPVDFRIDPGQFSTGSYGWKPGARIEAGLSILVEKRDWMDKVPPAVLTIFDDQGEPQTFTMKTATTSGSTTVGWNLNGARVTLAGLPCSLGFTPRIANSKKDAPAQRYGAGRLSLVPCFNCVIVGTKPTAK